jgi:DNA-directed RNA polymerase III subunit RPC2
MVADKIHARSTGKVTVLTRQPTEGRSKEGGLRLGEMERDCLLGFGAGEVLLERLLYSSDDSTVLICSSCGFFQGGKRCESCRTGQVRKVKMPYACKLLMQELISMGIRPKINLGKVADNPFAEETK